MEAPILIDVWTVEPERRSELIALISDTLKGLVMRRMGFVSADIYESMNGGIVLVTVRMRTASDRRELTDSTEVRQAYRRARSIARRHANNYRVVESFGDGCGPEEPVDAKR
jgi:hypothetical protein